MTLSAVKEKSQEVLDAKERKLNSLKENNVFNWVEDHGQHSVSCKCVFTEKQKENGSKMLKAQLVAQWFEEKSINKRTNSPMCSCQTLIMVFVLTSIMLRDLHSIDITWAFLQGNTIKRKVFVQSPSEVMDKGKIWKLQRCIYVLNDAPKEWYNRVEQELLKLGERKNLHDKAMFQWNNKDGAHCGIIVTHVDDFVYCSTLNCIFKIFLYYVFFVYVFFVSLRSARKKRDLSDI